MLLLMMLSMSLTTIIVVDYHHQQLPSFRFECSSSSSQSSSYPSSCPSSYSSSYCRLRLLGFYFLFFKKPRHRCFCFVDRCSIQNKYNLPAPSNVPSSFLFFTLKKKAANFCTVLKPKNFPPVFILEDAVFRRVSLCEDRIALSSFSSSISSKATIIWRPILFSSLVSIPKHRTLVLCGTRWSLG